MRTIRRLYVYTVAFISLEVVVWGLIGLARSVVGEELIGSDASQLASALSLIAVGVPVFLLHWWLSQRTIKDNQERFARLRAVFLYAALLATLIPGIQNILALVNRIWLLIFDLPVRMAFLGEGQSWIDNIIAVVMNGLIAAYMLAVLRRDWAIILQDVPPEAEPFVETRRLYRYLWVFYSLAMVVGGVQQTLSYILNLGEPIGSGVGANLANGLTLLLLGTPLWFFVWRVVQGSLAEEDERRSTLRLVVLYILSLAGVGGVLVSSGVVLDVIFRAVLGESQGFSRLLTEISGPLSVAIPFGGVWVYYQGMMRREVASLPDTPRRAGLRRLYAYILSGIGLVATVFGLNALLSFIIDTLIHTANPASALRARLSLALSTLTISLPLWLMTWRPMVIEASQDGEPGDHARRSLVRKVYLYLALFAGVIGVMASAGALIYQLLSKVLGDPPENFERASWMLLETLGLFAILLAYHWSTLRADGRLAEKSLAARHQSFPVLILVAEIGNFSEEMLNVLQREVPSLPVVVHSIDNGVPDELISEARAVILPGDLAANPTEATRLWLQGFAGIRFVVPTPSDGWLWTFGSGRPLPALARQTAHMVRSLAEGEEIPIIREGSSWMVVLYILAGLLGIPLLFSLFSLLTNILY
ncbi:MAG: DUF5671 domain-containing protein [Anaerolineales bacterium]|nr:DUF5671 domain-containing protein [Anaerolineales bacterium]